MKILITFYGETFRKKGGGQFSRKRSLDDTTIKYQNLATESHVRLIEHIKNTFNAYVTVTLLSYTMEDEYDKQLLEKYNCKKFELVKDINNPPWETPSSHGEINMLKYLSTVFKEERDKNDYNLFIRLDFYIKEYFLKCLKFDNTIKFAFPDTNTHLMKFINQSDDNISLDKKKGYNFLVCHCICQYPKKYYYLLDKYNILKSYHSIFERLSYNVKFDKPDLSFFVNSFHCSSTNYSWNPLYANIGREELLVYHLDNHLGSKVVEINGVWGCGPVTNYYYDYKDNTIKRDTEINIKNYI